MHAIWRCLAGVLLITFQVNFAHGQSLQPGELKVGRGAGQIGLLTPVNEECHGPATITPAANGGLAILDRVNGKIVVLDTRHPRDIPLPPDLVEPTDFVATTIGYLVVGALGEVATVDVNGRIVGRTKTGYDPESGSPRLIAMPAGRFALENLSGHVVPINLPARQTGSALVAGMALAGDYTNMVVNPGKMVLSSTAISGPLSSIAVTSDVRLVSARVMWAEAGRGALLAVQESRELPDESTFVRLVNVDAKGKPTDEAYLGPDVFACDTVRAFTRLTDGRIVSLSFQQPNRLALRILTMRAVGTATPVVAAEETGEILIAAESGTLDDLERKNGTSDSANISMSSISRPAILQRAREALQIRWFLSASAYSRPDVENACDPPRSAWLRAKILEGRQGTWRTGIPYAWGSYLPELDVFRDRISRKYLAGNVCTCRTADCVNRKAVGLDCSGFVSYAWQTGKYYTTASLPKAHVSMPIRWTALAPGDIVNKANSHVRLVEAVHRSPRGAIATVIESTTLPSCGGVCRRSYSLAELQAKQYKPFRRLQLGED